MTITIIKSSAGVKRETKHSRGTQCREGVADETLGIGEKKKGKKKKEREREVTTRAYVLRD